MRYWVLWILFAGFVGAQVSPVSPGRPPRVVLQGSEYSTQQVFVAIATNLDLVTNQGVIVQTLTNLSLGEGWIIIEQTEDKTVFASGDGQTYGVVGFEPAVAGYQTNDVFQTVWRENSVGQHIDQQLRSRMDSNTYTYDWQGNVPGPFGWVWTSNSWFIHQYSNQPFGVPSWPTNLTRNSVWPFRDVTNMTGVATARCGNYEMTPGCYPWMFTFQLITPRHVLGCGHCSIYLNELVTFYTADNQMRQARLIAVSNLHTIDFTEVTIGVLNQELEGIEPLLYLPVNYTNYIGFADRLPVIGVNQDKFSGVLTSIGDVYHPSSRNSYVRAGDSGSPGLYIINNQFVLGHWNMGYYQRVTETIAGLNVATGLTNQIRSIDLSEFVTVR